MGTHPIFESDFDCLTDMGKTLRIVVAGGTETGKTSMLERLIYNNYDPDKKMFPTKEDIFLGQVDIRNRRELLRIHDTSGDERTRLACPPRHLCHYGDAFLLTYDITSEESFTQVKRIKAEIEKELNKASGVYIAVAAMKTDSEEQVKTRSRHSRHRELGAERE